MMGGVDWLMVDDLRVDLDARYLVSSDENTRFTG